MVVLQECVGWEQGLVRVVCVVVHSHTEVQAHHFCLRAQGWCLVRVVGVHMCLVGHLTRLLLGEQGWLRVGVH